MTHDFRYAIRSLWRSPGFAVIAIVTLGLGIGANTAIFTVINAVLLRPLPYEQADRLARVYSLHEGRLWTVSPPDFVDWRRDNHTFVDLAAFHPRTVTLTGEGRAERVDAAVAGPSLFPVLGTGPAIGRGFQAEDAVFGGHLVAVLSHGLWQRRFGADPNVIGRSVTLDGQSFTVIGVMPQGFAFPRNAELWIPLAFTEDDLTTQRGAHYLTVVGRLQPGIGVDEAAADIRAMAARIEEEHPNTSLGWTATAVDLRESFVGDVRTALLLLLGAVGLVLLIACANVANLLLVRALERDRELALRAALGANRFRILRGLLAESVVLGLLGGAVGLLMAQWGIELLAALRPQDIPRMDEVAIDGRVVGFATGIAVLTAFLFGLLPGLRASFVLDLRDRLAEGGRSLAAARSTRRAKSGLVILETALAVVLLTGASLLMRSFAHLNQVDPGFDPDRLLTFGLHLPEARYPEPRQAGQFYAELMEGIEAVPGVQSADAVFGLPLSGFFYSMSVYDFDGRRTTPESEPSVQVRVVTPGYFANMGIPVLSGREFTEADRADGPLVAMVNESAARMLWPGDVPLGHRFSLSTRLGLDGEHLGGEVVGVARDFKHRGLGEASSAEIYVAHSQFPVASMSMVVRTASEPGPLVEPITQMVSAMDPEVPAHRVRTMNGLIDESLADSRFYMFLMVVFAVTALVLAAVGTYGVMAHAVTQRSRELGIRMALGARRGEVLAMVLKSGLGLGAVGAAIGLAAAYATTRVMSGLLYEVAPTDTVTFVSVPLFLFGVTLLASYLPANRATKVNPVQALRGP